MIPLSGDRAEVAFEVAEPWRRRGVAGQLLEALVAAAARTGVRELSAEVLEENADMLAVLREHGLHSERQRDGVVSLQVPVPGGSRDR
jgi:GNAT superfamily N-acetyltransferase